MAISDEENLSEIKREIFKIMNCSGEPAPQIPPADDYFRKKTADSTQDPGPMDAQEQETTTHTDASNYVDLTNTVNSEIKGNATYAYVNG